MMDKLCGDDITVFLIFLVGCLFAGGWLLWDYGNVFMSLSALTLIALICSVVFKIFECADLLQPWVANLAMFCGIVFGVINLWLMV